MLSGTTERKGWIFADAAIVLASFIIAYQIRLTEYFQSNIPAAPVSDYLWLALAAIPVWGLVLYANGIYQPLRRKTILNLSASVFRAGIITLIILASLIFVVQAKTYSRSMFGLFLIFLISNTIVTRVFAKIYVQSNRHQSLKTRNIAIVGTNENARSLAKQFLANPLLNFRITGFVLAEHSPRDSEIKELDLNGLAIPILGNLIDLGDIAEAQVIDDVLFCSSRQNLPGMENALAVCEELGIRAHLVADFFNLPNTKMEFGYIDKVPILTFHSAPSRELDLLIKRALDIVISFVMLLVFILPGVIISILIKLDSPGPIFFIQQRCGLNGRHFSLLKFRSMLKNAESTRQDIETINEMSGPVFKSSTDPRITRIGHFLRKFSLDEFPQLINVLLGQMTLVGPRPPIPSEVLQYERWQRRRLSMKPGLTCIWQISGRNNIDFTEWMKMDLQYIDHWSLALDIKILLKTIPAVLSGRGAS